jgi:4-hydroxyphenylacetate 3-monooxygenase
MGARRGSAYLEQLRTHGPEVWLGGQRVEDVTSHPALAPVARELARLYDLRFDPRHTAQMLYPSPADGQPVGVDFLVPQSVHDLQRRREFHQIWAEATFGLMGRTTDFLSAILRGYPETLSLHRRKLMQHPCGNEIQGDRKEQVGSA